MQIVDGCVFINSGPSDGSGQLSQRSYAVPYYLHAAEKAGSHFNGGTCGQRERRESGSDCGLPDSTREQVCFSPFPVQLDPRSNVTDIIRCCRVSPKTLLTFCTSGVLLRTLISGGDHCLATVTHIIVVNGLTLLSSADFVSLTFG